LFFILQDEIFFSALFPAFLSFFSPLRTYVLITFHVQSQKNRLRRIFGKRMSETGIASACRRHFFSPPALLPIPPAKILHPSYEKDCRDIDGIQEML